MNGNVTVYGVFFLQSFNFKDSADATVVGEDLVAGESDNFADAQTGINADSEKQAIARRFQDLEDVLNIFCREDASLAWN